MSYNYSYPQDWPPPPPPPPITSSNANNEQVVNNGSDDTATGLPATAWDPNATITPLDQHQFLSDLWPQSQQHFNPSPFPPSNHQRHSNDPVPSTSHHSTRYEPYHVPIDTQFPPSQYSSQQLSNLADPSYLLPTVDATTNGWINQHLPEADRRDSNSTQRSEQSRESKEHSDSAAADLASAAVTANTHGTKRPSIGGPARAVGNGEGAAAVGTGSSTAGTKKLVKKADKSCRKCRERRVRCDRVYPVCDRCRKRRETCQYVESVNVDEFEEGGDAQKIVELQSKVAALERQLKSNVGPSPTSDLNTTLISPVDRNPQSRRSSNNDSSPGTGASSSNASGSNRTPPSSDLNSSSILANIGEIYSAHLRFKPEEADTLVSYLMGKSIASKNLGRSNPNWRLGEPAVMRQLTIHLMEAATHACCSKIPGIKPLADRVEYYKRNLDRLDGAGQCAVAVLSALGARASPHSALLGVATTCLADGTPSPPLFLYAGERREIACRTLERRAREVCWINGMLESTNLPDLDAIIGLTQLLIFESDEEILPEKSRLFARIAVGMYHDLRFKALERGERTSRDPRIGPGTALFLADAVIASASSRPSFISTSELDTYFLSDGVPIPDFPGTNLGTELDKILQEPLNKDKLVDAVTSGIIWVSGCSRLFAQLTMTRRSNTPSPLPLLKNLWSLIDSVHNSLQHLQSIFVHLDVSRVSDLEDTAFAMDYFVLLGVRADSILVDLINLMHVWLTKDRNGEGIWTEREDDPLLEDMRHESELRVRKCLKLSAFYAQLFLSSQDKHLVHHMIMQLEILPDWTDRIMQRVGTPGGPESEEYEVTPSELDWFQRALELSCYYTPKAASRLQRFTAARQSVAQLPPARLAAEPSVPPFSLDHTVPQQALYDNALFQGEESNENNSNEYSSSSNQGMFQLGGGWVTNPSEIFVFDNYGIAAQLDHPLDGESPIAREPIFQNSFTGESWMEIPRDQT